MNSTFENMEHPFAHKSIKELKQSRFLFKVVFKPWVIAIAKPMIKLALMLHIPIKWAVKPTVYKYFCGGENLNEALKVVDKLNNFNVKTVLDFAAEETNSPLQAEKTFKQIMEIIQLSAKNKSIAFAVFKPSALCSVSTLTKVSEKKVLSPIEQKEFDTFLTYVDYLCQEAYNYNLPILIDAEYVSMQNAIDDVLWDMMLKYNKDKAMVFNTLQMYRKDRLAYLKQLYEKAMEQNILVGIKFVRGAYLEQERKWAKEKNQDSPVHDTKEATDNDFDAAIAFCMEHLNVFSIFCGTHNEKSCLLLTEAMEKYKVNKNDARIYFSQLLGMSDHISFNLAYEGYNIAKYVPFGPVKITIPYLLRRADENKSIGSQISRELQLIDKAIKIRQYEMP